VNISAKIVAFSILGKFFNQFSSISFLENKEISGLNEIFRKSFENDIKEAAVYNPWFTEEFIRYSLKSISSSLLEKKISQWIMNYPEIEEISGNQKRIGVVMAGNIPLAGFHDMISTIFSDHIFHGKMSSKDNKLFPIIKKLLCQINPEFEEKIYFSEDPLKNIDAIIATGSNNSSRYFEYYFGKYPNIIRKNRNSVAIITGNESKEELKKLADDVFLYFGLGCRNVSKIFIPVGYDPVEVLKNFEDYSYLYNHNKYANNYEYHKAIFLVDKVEHLDTGFLLLREDSNYSSPVGVIYYERYKSPNDIKTRLIRDKELVQCVVDSDELIPGAVRFGESQQPELWDYADNVDTLKFLFNLYKK